MQGTGQYGLHTLCYSSISITSKDKCYYYPHFLENETERLHKFLKVTETENGSVSTFHLAQPKNTAGGSTSLRSKRA